MASLSAASNAPAETPDEIIARLTAELREARDRQRAASAVLDAIARSPADTRPVFEAIVDNATRLCRAEFTAVARRVSVILCMREP